ncbi:hypothetical protein Dimus_016389 [Dionaea muscipula]
MRDHKPNIVYLCETRASLERIKGITGSLGMDRWHVVEPEDCDYGFMEVDGQGSKGWMGMVFVYRGPNHWNRDIFLKKLGAIVDAHQQEETSKLLCALRGLLT